MKHIGTTLAALLLGTTAGLAQTPGVQGVVDALKAHGYTDIEVEREGSRIKVEAYRDGLERELTYDAGTGKIVSDESHRTAQRPATAGEHDAGDDHGGVAGHDAGDDHGGTSASGHDAGDDHGSDTSGGGHDSGDDHGGSSGGSGSGSGHDGGDD